MSIIFYFLSWIVAMICLHVSYEKLLLLMVANMSGGPRNIQKYQRREVAKSDDVVKPLANQP